VSLRPSGTLDLLNFLERAELDLVISALDAPADRFAARTLVVDHYVVVMRRGHPAAKLTLDIEGFAKLPAPHLRREKHANPPAAIESIVTSRTTIEIELCRGDGGRR
jgi:DNA-binding transcriptional LysR family regulator